MTPRDVTRDLSRSLYRFARLAWPHLEVPGGSSFRPNWHLATLCDLLEAFRRRDPRDLVINVPPATGKSLFSGVLFPAWVWTIDPSHRFIYASYDSALLHRDAEILLGLLRSRWYRETFGDVLRPGPVAVGNFELRGGGGRLSTSIRGAVTGWHAHTLIVDDPNKAQDVIRSPGELEFAWQSISTAFSNRTIDPATFGRLLIGQRLAIGDPFDRAIEAGWARHAFPMRAVRDAETSTLDTRGEDGEILFPARFPPDAVATLEEGMRLLGTWEAQYQQRPVVQGSGAILPEWIDVVPREVVPRDATFIQSWDLTFKGRDASDWIAGQWWARTRDDQFYLLDTVFRRASFVETIAEIVAHRSAWPSSRVLIEDAANGPACEDVLRAEIGGLELVTPEGSKEARAVAVTPLWRAGRVHVVDGPHVARIRREWPKFPRMDRDDEIDAMSQALRYLSRGAGYAARLMAILRGGKT